MTTTTHDLGHGWYANWTRGDDAETMTVRNCDLGLRIDLPAESLTKLRTIMSEAKAAAERPAIKLMLTLEATARQSGRADTPFLRFWEALNAAMKDSGQPEIMYGDARHYWHIAQGK